MENTLLCYDKCNTCKKAIKFLDEAKIKYAYRDIKENNPTQDELNSWIEKIKLPINKFFNTSGLIYKELNLKEKIKTMSEKELIELLSTNGMLVKRPIFITEKQILIGFNEKEWKSSFLDE
jgi:arsenate reductase